MSVQENIISEIHSLDSEQLNELRLFLSFLKYRSYKEGNKAVDDPESYKLYALYEEEDRVLSESGISEYNAGLLKEDIL
jgi:hypothetical protein